MNAKELAQLLDGREYTQEITREECKQAKADGLVVVYGASDDLMEFAGAIDNEVGCDGGGEVHVNEAGFAVPVSECRSGDDCPHWQKLAANAKKNAHKIEAVWCGGPDAKEMEPQIAWTFKTDIPHETFDIMEDGQTFCRGIVFALKDAKKV